MKCEKMKDEPFNLLYPLLLTLHPSPFMRYPSSFTCQRLALVIGLLVPDRFNRIQPRGLDGRVDAEDQAHRH